MSMALAFAQGLVGGFMKNRQEKKAEIETQQSKLDDFTKIVMQGMITAKANGKPFPTELGARLKKAKAGLADQGPIDIFGRGKVNKFELDLSEMSNIMGAVSTYGRSYGTPKTYELGFKAENVFDEKNSRSFLSEAIALTKSDIGMNKLRLLKTANPAAYKEFLSAVQSSSLIIRNKEKEVNPNQDKNYMFKTRNITNEYHPLFGIDTLYNIDSGESNEVAITGSVDLSRINSINNYIDKLKKEKKPVPNYITIVGGDENNDQIISLNLNNINDVNQTAKMTTNFNIAKGGNVFDYWHNKHLTLPGMKAEDKTRFFKYSVNIGKKISNIENLDPDKDLYRLLANEEVAHGIYKTIVDNTDDTSISRIYALSSYMTGPNKHLDIAQPAVDSGYAIVTNPYNKSNYAAMMYYGKDKSSSDTFATMETKFNDVDIVTKNIGNLYNKIDELNESSPAPMMYQYFKQSFEAVFSPTEGVFGGIVSDIASFKIDDDNTNRFDKKELSSGYLKELAYRDNKNRSEVVAQIQALRITLAFQMARAADPSGRLSNQDIEQQMAKLGGNLATPTAMKGALRVTLQEFMEQRQKLNLLIKFGKGTDPATDSDFKLIDAVIANDALRENYMRFKNLGSDRTTGGSTVLDPEATFDDDGTTINRYVLSLDGKFYIDQVLGTKIPINKFKNNI